MKINLKNNIGYTWFSKDGVNVRGYFYFQGEYYNDEKMIDLFENVTSIEDFSSVLKRINGYYTIVIIKDHYLLAATDRINSTPIFFTNYNNEFIISDDYRYVFNDDFTEDQTSVHEYLLLGYTTGNNTIYKNISQLKPGEGLFYNSKDNKIQLFRHYEYLHKRDFDLSEEELINKLSEVHDEVFKRFIASLEGRKVIVPLSGGYDSRLIVEMLRKNDYDNVLCVTWGNASDWQVKIAKEVASKLSYQWISIEHSRKDWYEWFNSKAYNNMNIITGCISSIPYLQENVSIDYLEKNYNIPKDSIFVSGNSGDFIEGQHIPEDLIENDLFTPNQIADMIFRKHFRLLRLNDSNYKSSLYERILDIIGRINDANSDQAASLFEYWEWQERQSKFVSNSIKSFESKGYEWRLPLWDNEIMDFWSRVPLKYRYGRALFYKYSDKFMVKDVVHANPRVSKFKIYKERIMDSRYGCFSGEYGKFRSLLLRDKDVFNDEILDLIEKKYLIVHKLNGLLALWNLIYMKNHLQNIIEDVRSHK